MDLMLIKLNESDLVQYKADMQEAFLLGAIDGGFPEDTGEILPESDIDRSLAEHGAVAYKAVLDGKIVGGAIIVIDEKKSHGHLDFLYVKYGCQNLGIGKFIWFEIERLHPEIRVWETCTPYFEKRNLHFYLNVCHFHIVEFWNEKHKNSNEPNDTPLCIDNGCDEMFGFRKEIQY